MGSKLTLSVVDQSPVRAGGTGGDALRESIELAALVEQWGYERYWVAEHHNIPNFAGASPELLIGQIAARTSRIRVGSGGVMLSHYSALKVAENFRVLESLFPGRIDLGIGRAPGSDQLTAAALAYPGRVRDIAHFPRQVLDVIGYLHEGLEEGHIFSDVQAGPGECSAPDVWLLGSRYESAFMAADLGLPFAYAHFFGMRTEDGPGIVNAYKERFQPSRFLQEPKVNVSVHVLCAETREEAERLASSRNVARILSLKGMASGIPPVEEALSYNFSPLEMAHTAEQRKRCVDGDPEYVRTQLEAVAETYGTTDLGVVTVCYAFEDRARSYELVAQACGLIPASDSEETPSGAARH